MQKASNARLEAQVPADMHALLKRAAEIQGRSITDFVLDAAREAACRTIEETEMVSVSAEDQKRIAKAILDPPAATPALRRAFQRRKKLFGE